MKKKKNWQSKEAATLHLGIVIFFSLMFLQYDDKTTLPKTKC